jgi:hypothetical protein
LQQAETHRQRIRRQVAQRDVIGQQQQPDLAQRRIGRRALAQVATHDGQLGAKVDAPFFARQHQILRGAEQTIGCGLAQLRRVAPNGRQAAAQCALFQVVVVQISGAAHAGAGARERRHATGGVEVERAARFGVALAVVQLTVECIELRGNEDPVIERGAQTRRDAVGNVGSGQVARHHGQLAVTGAVVQRGKFHGRARGNKPAILRYGRCEAINT